MRSALIDDLLALPEKASLAELIVLNDDRCPPPRENALFQVVTISGDAYFLEIWKQWIARCDAVWPIAPESSGILEQLCLDVEAEGKVLLNSSSDAVRLAGSKLKTANRLARSGLPVVPTVPLGQWRLQDKKPFVIKPDDGVGCEGIRIVRDPDRVDMPMDSKNLIAQPLLEGDALSLSIIFGKGRARLLSCNHQKIEESNGSFFLKGCRVNALVHDGGDEFWQELAESIAQAMPELWGYAGVDLIMTRNGPVILEINPRLTTSYAGIRQATGDNPAAMVLDLLENGILPTLRNRQGEPVEVWL